MGYWENEELDDIKPDVSFDKENSFPKELKSFRYLYGTTWSTHREEMNGTL